MILKTLHSLFPYLGIREGYVNSKLIKQLKIYTALPVKVQMATIPLAGNLAISTKILNTCFYSAFPPMGIINTSTKLCTQLSTAALQKTRKN